MINEQKSIDISSRKVVAMRDVQEAVSAGATRIVIAENCVVTPSAKDFLQQRNIALVSSRTSEAGSTPVAAPVPSTLSAGASPIRTAPNPRLFSTPEAEAIKKEICETGKKLWLRQFVDGNGGNISYRIGPNEVLCTPTLVSKYDLKPEDISLVDLEGNQIAGSKPRTSEIFLHLEIYKAVPQAKSCVHCHPPHATAYAITGKVPPNLVIPEFEVFVGKVAISPYKTPGTAEFAQTVIPFVKDHNTVLLSNHGIICWGDTVTHAEWYAEVLDTYCWTLMNAAQLGVPISHISEQQGEDLLAIKKKLGLPDIRFDTSRMKECQLSDLEIPGSIALTPTPCDGATGKSADADIESLVKSVTDAVMEAIGSK
ncbi:MAG: class II aldolase/adducin family protein [Terracidiphilus sp.]|nr:class II aldolase/adducin family protein [Terracidiphilus sp.]